ncbi:glycosyltransferase [Legionella sp. WA2022007384]
MKRKQINFLANPHSPHVRHWEDLLNSGNYETCIYTAHKINQTMIVNAPVKEILPKIFNRIPMAIKYLISGLSLRFSRSKSNDTFFHAHNTSGYGLMAYLSGRPYILTTYGTEIFSTSSKSKIYSLLLRKILKNAMAITSASPSMTDYLINYFGIERSKIHEFSLGVTSSFCFSQEKRDKIRNELQLGSSPVWIVNRRIRCQYHTLELIDAFNRFRNETNTGFLILLEGDSEASYLENVEQCCAQNPYIHLIKGFISQQEMSYYLSAADFSISVPETDQLSSSILEGASCGAIPLLTNLKSYQLVREFSKLFDIPDPNNSLNYDPIFFESYKMFLTEEYTTCRANMFNKISSFSMNNIVPKVIHLYDATSSALHSNL